MTKGATLDDVLAELRALPAKVGAEVRRALAERAGTADALAPFLAAFHELHGGRHFTAAEAVRLAAEETERGRRLRQALALAVDLDGTRPAGALGQALTRRAAHGPSAGLTVEVVPTPRHASRRFCVARASSTDRKPGKPTGASFSWNDPFRIGRSE
jgi:hypothetical protein